MKRIPLTQGQFAIVDDKDFEWLCQWKWYAAKNMSHSFYAIRGHYKENKMNTVRLHRVVLGLKRGDGLIADHVNGDTLDNRKANLRLCTARQNCQNAKKYVIPTSSKYKGVNKCKRQRKHDINETWMARITIKDNKRLYLGHYKSEVQAARAYNEAATQYFGEFARLNII